MIKLSSQYNLNKAEIYKITIYLILLLFYFYKVNFYVNNVPIGIPPDEIAHVSYVYHLHENNKFVPQFGEMHIIDKSGQWQKTINHIVHPPLYYKFLSLFIDNEKTVAQNIIRLRYINLHINILSVIIFLYIAYGIKVATSYHLLYATSVTSLPLLGFIGGAVNNDNISILGNALIFLGIVCLFKNNKKITPHLLISIGFCISYFSKTTSALLSFFLLIFFFVYILKNQKDKILNKYFYISLLFYIIPIAYQLYVCYNYNALLPSHGASRENILPGRAYASPGSLTFMEWSLRFLEWKWRTWVGIHAHMSIEKQHWIETIGFAFVHLFAAIGLFMKDKTQDKKLNKIILLSKFGALSILITSLIQLIFSYKTHLRSGYLGGLQARYYLPFLPVIPLLAINFLNRYKPTFIVSIFIIFISLHIIYFDFFYFLIRTGLPVFKS